MASMLLEQGLIKEKSFHYPSTGTLPRKKALPKKSPKCLIFLVGVGGIEPPTN